MVQPNSTLEGLTATPEPLVEALDSTPEAEVLEQQGQAEGQAPSAETKEKETPPDLKVANERLERENARLKGQVKARDTAPAWAEALQRENRSTREHLNLVMDAVLQGEDGDRTALRSKWSQMQQQAQSEEAGQPYKALSQEWAQEANDKAADLNIGIFSDRRTRPLAEAWNKAASTGDAVGVWRARRELMAVLDEMTTGRKEQERQAQEKQRLNERRQAGALKTDSGQAGGGAGTSEQELVNRFSQGDEMTQDEMTKANAALERGIRPKIAAAP